MVGRHALCRLSAHILPLNIDLFEQHPGLPPTMRFECSYLKIALKGFVFEIVFDVQTSSRYFNAGLFILDIEEASNWVFFASILRTYLQYVNHRTPDLIPHTSFFIFSDFVEI